MPKSDRTAASTFDRVASDLGHEAFPALAGSVRSGTAQILETWHEQSIQAMPHLEDWTLREFEDSIAQILSAAADALASADPQQLRGLMDKAPLHGLDRFLQKYSLLDLFEEVRILRGVIVVEVTRQMRRLLTVPEAATFHAIFDVLIQQGVMTHVQRQAEERAQNEAAVASVNGKLVEALVRNDELLAESRLLQEKVSSQAQALQRESRLKDEFLATLSHELRNPLAPIRAALHLLRSEQRPGAEDPLQKQAHEIIERQVGNLTKLIGDLLEVSRVVNGRVHLSTERVDLNLVVQHAVETATPLIEKNKHTLVLHLCTEPVWASVDPARMEQVFINLLNNAAKYTPNGGTIEVWCENPGGIGEAQFRVRDTGVGIPEDLLKGGRLFDLFTQADRSLARSAGGLGIGLSLAHRLVQLHGGTIEAHSPPEGARPEVTGSEFIVRLPLTPMAQAPAATESVEPAPAQGLRVLLVDDNVDLVTMLAAALRHRGHSVVTAHTGPEGIALAQQWRPDVILLDIGLPGLDGYEVARRLRRDPEFNTAGGGMTLIALTGYGRDADKALAQEAGFDGHLVKPFEFEELRRLIAAARAAPTVR